MELRRWFIKWKEEKDHLPSNSLTALNMCDMNYFPYINLLLRVFSVTPTTSCEPERAFSELKRIKTSIRSTISQDRLDNLMILKIHPDVAIDVGRVANSILSVEME